MSDDTIKNINKTIVHEDGKIDSFDKQLINLSGGIFDVRFPLVVSDNTNCLSYISTINESKPLTMMVSTAIKIREKHDIGFAYVSQVNDLLKNSIMAFESLKHDTSVIVLLDDYDDIDDPMIAVCRTDKKVGYVEFSDYLGYWKMIDQTESNGSIYYCFESKDDSSYPFLVVDEDLNVLCESFEELEDAVENYLSENELDMSI